MPTGLSVVAFPGPAGWFLTNELVAEFVDRLSLIVTDAACSSSVCKCSSWAGPISSNRRASILDNSFHTFKTRLAVALAVCP